MWSRRVAVQHWRGLNREPADLSPHLNLVFGPNEAGKRRLVEGMRFALFESSSGKSQHNKALTTWGRTEKTSVTLDSELSGGAPAAPEDFSRNGLEHQGARRGREAGGDGDRGRVRYGANRAVSSRASVVVQPAAIP